MIEFALGQVSVPTLMLTVAFHAGHRTELDVEQQRWLIQQGVLADVRDHVTGNALGIGQAAEGLMAGETIITGPLVRLHQFPGFQHAVREECNKPDEQDDRPKDDGRSHLPNMSTVITCRIVRIPSVSAIGRCTTRH